MVTTLARNLDLVTLLLAVALGGAGWALGRRLQAVPGGLVGLVGVGVGALLFWVVPPQALSQYLHGVGRASFVVYEVLAVPLALSSLVLAVTAATVNGQVALRPQPGGRDPAAADTSPTGSPATRP